MRGFRCAIFASGTGSNAEALLRESLRLKASTVAVDVSIEFVFSDRSAAPVLHKAQELGFKTVVIEKTSSRLEHENEILKLLRAHKIDWIFLAGYMRILSANFLSEFSAGKGRPAIVNIHPSLLPLYAGSQAMERAFSDQVMSGVTLHYVDAGIDTGEVIAQQTLGELPGSDFSEFAGKMHRLEHKMYINFLNELAQGKHAEFFLERAKKC